MYINDRNTKTVKSSTPPHGFTLAETLITLVIIGVIAALTVPTLIVKYQKEQTVTKLKKAYSALSQALQKASMDYGSSTTWNYPAVHSAPETIEFINKYIKPYMQIVGEITSADEGKWDINLYKLNNTLTNYSSYNVRFYLNDGTSYTFWSGSAGLDIYIDINGDKKPNKVGRDIFRYLYSLSAPRLVPDGYGQKRSSLISDTTYNCNKNQSGSRCAALIMKDGWQIKDDYPW